MRVLITGSTGMLGCYVHDLLKDKHEIHVTTRNNFDLRQPDGFTQVFENLKPEVVIHLAAETNVDLCEKDPSHAYVCNSLAVKQIAELCAINNVYFLFISTSNVFGMEGRASYNELDSIGSINYYGKSKCVAEKYIEQARNENSLIIRAGWMIGGGKERDHKFVGKLISQFSTATSVMAVDDKYGTITSAKRLALYIDDCLKEKRIGTRHFSAVGAVSRYGLAKRIAEKLRFNGSITGVPSSYFPLSAPRPQSEAIDSIYVKIENVQKFYLPWEEEIDEYLGEF